MELYGMAKSDLTSCPVYATIYQNGNALWLAVGQSLPSAANR